MVTATLMKGRFDWGLTYSFRGFSHYYQGREHGSLQEDVALEEKLRVLHLGPQTAGRQSSWPCLGFRNLKAHL